jgi:hypothetical protein
LLILSLSFSRDDPLSVCWNYIPFLINFTTTFITFRRRRKKEKEEGGGGKEKEGGGRRDKGEEERRKEKKRKGSREKEEGSRAFVTLIHCMDFDEYFSAKNIRVKSIRGQRHDPIE